MGLIMVIGIVAKNGILLLDADQKFRSWDFSPEDATIQAGRRRLRIPRSIPIYVPATVANAVITIGVRASDSAATLQISNVSTDVHKIANRCKNIK